MKYDKKLLQIIGIAALFIALAIFLVVQLVSAINTKNITIEIIHPDEPAKIVRISTKAKYLNDAMEESELIMGEDGPFGYWLTGVDGYVADDSKGEWWAFSQNGEAAALSVAETKIKNKDKFEFTLKVGPDYGTDDESDDETDYESDDESDDGTDDA